MIKLLLALSIILFTCRTGEAYLEDVVDCIAYDCDDPR